MGQLEVHGVFCVGEEAAIERAVRQLNCQSMAGRLLQQLLRDANVLRHGGGEEIEEGETGSRSGGSGGEDEVMRCEGMLTIAGSVCEAVLV